MPQPQFELQSIIILRERQRDAAAGAYRDALAAKAKLEAHIDQLLHEHDEQRPLQAGNSSGLVNTQKLIESQRYQLQLLQQVSTLRSQVELIDGECEKRRLNLVTKEQALSSLEKLKEKQQQQWKFTQQQREQETIDQWSSFRHWGQSRSS